MLRSAAIAAALVVSVAAMPLPTGATDTGISYEDPAWSPNGKAIAFVVQRAEKGGWRAVGVIDPNGKSMRTITPYMAGVEWPTWSPDNRKVAFVSSAHLENGDPSIYVSATGGGKPHLLAVGFHPAWSPGGHKIAFNTSTLEDPVGDILVMDPDGRGQRVVAASEATTAFQMPTWSPDGQRLAFVADSAPDQDNGLPRHLAYISQYNGKIRVLSLAQEYEPNWSRGGRKIAYTFIKDNQPNPPTFEVRVLDLSSGRIVFLHAGRHPSWSPQGDRIVFTNGPAFGPQTIFVMNSDGSGVRQLTR